MSLSYFVFIIGHTLSNRSWQFSIVFFRHHTCTISHIVVLFDFCDRPHLVQLIIVLSCLRHRPHIIWSVLTIQYCIMQRSLYYDWSWHCPIWFSWYNASYPMISHVFVMTVRRRTTLSDRSCHCPISFHHRPHRMIILVVVLSGLCDRLHIVWSVMIGQFWFRCRSHLYDNPCHYPIWTSS